jgi:hypothetical protein
LWAEDAAITDSRGLSIPKVAKDEGLLQVRKGDSDHVLAVSSGPLLQPHMPASRLANAQDNVRPEGDVTQGETLEGLGTACAAR